ncbi:tRNA-uridine aminocarboxypropyltransferase [Anaeromyxobacter sp. PSR-1]|uniref:tRNA-uridine aminocarboxypropyltransferase n=1 Tax=Anaeromyxobacter sp. PSR-1 TaxID=1300915 RepID=UPI0005E23D0D|nr:tRNA-uridine aminocarboxypropyltransferase [Anaeromyxobacter sp. PSR-1]GAO02386.1 DTW domain-containing protein YfiP [Anaeromyxobacter sp. PSR-1]
MPPAPDRCPRCAFPTALCLCAEVPRLRAPVRFLIVRHASERERMTNTARWAALALPGTEILEHGLPGEPLALPDLAAAGAVALFPSPVPTPPPAAPPRLVVVPDGTWSQARRMMQRIPALQRLPRLTLGGPPGGLRLRRPPRADGMSTLEAMAGALSALGAPDAAERLLGLHAVAVERVLRLRGTWEAGCAEAAHGHLPRA